MADEKGMTARRISWIVYSALVILLGLAIIVTSLSIFYVGIAGLRNEGGAVGIIGGADGPTAEYLTRNLNATVGQILRFGALVLISGIVAISFNRFFSKHCAVETSVISIALSSVVGLGLTCVLLFASCSIMDHPKNHPIRYPASFWLGVICFLVFLILIALYFVLRIKRLSVKGIIFDVAVSVIYVAPFFAFFCNMYDPLAEIIKKALGI